MEWALLMPARLAKEGAKVVCSDVLDDQGKLVADKITAEGGDCTFVHLDVGDSADWTAAIDATLHRFGRLDILVNNAGIPSYPGATELTDDEWDFVVRVNQTGVFYGIRAAVPAMRQAGGGSIINVSSVFADHVPPEYFVYAATKAAVQGMT